MNYKKVRNTAYRFDPRIKDEGTSSGQLGIILNKLKFKKVTIYSSDYDVVDYSWRNLSRKELMTKVKDISVYAKAKEGRESAFWYYKFLLKRSFDNNLVVSSDFGNIIRTNIDAYRPVLIDYNWSQMFNQPKVNRKEEEDYIKGDVDYHAVVIVGYTKEKVCILDSHSDMRKSNKVDPISDGCYYIKWEHLVMSMGQSDMIVPEKYGD